MLYGFAFEKVGVVASDLYFLDPNSATGQEGAEQGVRLEVRIFEREPLQGSIYSAQPIAVGRPIWRLDLLESVEHPGTFDRTHHHPRFRGWEPGRRNFVEELSAEPFAWMEKRLSDLDGLLVEAGVEADAVDPSDSESLRQSVPEIVDACRKLLDRVRAGELGQPPAEGAGEGARVSWL